MKSTVRRTFRSLRVRNFRLFFVGQFISAVGLWMQQVAELWLILQLTDSPAALGAITATHFGPILVLGLWGGVIADRVDKRRLLMVTQTLLGLLAAGLAITSARGVLGVATLFGFSFAVGLVTALDNPTRRSFVREMVPLTDVPNAVSLNSTLFTSARIIGPMISGILLATQGPTVVFTVNAISYIAVLAALWLMRPAELYRTAPVPRGPGQLVEGLRYAWRTDAVRLSIVMMAWIGTLSFNFSLLLTLFADHVFDAGSASALSHSWLRWRPPTSPWPSSSSPWARLPSHSSPGPRGWLRRAPSCTSRGGSWRCSRWSSWGAPRSGGSWPVPWPSGSGRGPRSPWAGWSRSWLASGRTASPSVGAVRRRSITPLPRHDDGPRAGTAVR
jgi:MFS family permease